MYTNVWLPPRPYRPELDKARNDSKRYWRATLVDVAELNNTDLSSLEFAEQTGMLRRGEVGTCRELGLA